MEMVNGPFDEMRERINDIMTLENPRSEENEERHWPVFAGGERLGFATSPSGLC